jgi:integrase
MEVGMGKGINRLSAVDLRRNKSGLYGDGGGLWLQVTPRKDGEGFSRSWIFRWTTADRTRSMGLGSLHTLGLAEARERARQCRQQRLDGIDPIEARDADRSAKAAAFAKAMTFEQAAHAYISAHRNEWRSQQHAQEWPSSLRKHIYPKLAKIDVAAIDTSLVVKALQPIWQKIPESASRLRGRIEAILDWSAVSGFRSGDNPARWNGHLEHLLAAPAKRKIEHLAAMPWREVPEFMAKLRATDSVQARAMELVILTAARKGEVRFATWGEVDFNTATWTVPGARMKAGKEHRVPLSPRAMTILREMNTAPSEHIFPGRNGPLGESAFEHLLKRLGHSGITLHGFRSAFRDWAGESTAFPAEIAEAALAHAVGNKVERSYRRGDALEKRRRLMEAWSDYCSKPAPAGATVTPLRAHAGASPGVGNLKSPARS